jgi:hypothetical protein
MASLSNATPSRPRFLDLLTERREIVLAVGALLGLVAALVSMVAPTERALNFGSVVAYVNDAEILRADYDRAIALLQTDRRSALTPEDRRDVLERLIEEELLVQRARDMGLTDSDTSVRKLLIRTMLETVVAQGGPMASDEELRAFFAANHDLFKSPPIVLVDRIVVRKTSPDVQEKLNTIRSSLTNPDLFADTKQKFSDDEIMSLPTDPVPAAKLRDYVGAGAVEKILAMREGEISEVDSESSVEFFHLISRDETTARYEDVRDEVAARFARAQDEEALRHYLAGLKSSADIDVDTSALQ